MDVAGDPGYAVAQHEFPDRARRYFVPQAVQLFGNFGGSRDRWPAGVPAPGRPGPAGPSARVDLRQVLAAARWRSSSCRARAAPRPRRARRARRRAPAGTAPTRARRGSRPRWGPAAPPGAAPRPPRGDGAPSGARGPPRTRAPRRWTASAGRRAAAGRGGVTIGRGRRAPPSSSRGRLRPRSAWPGTPCASPGQRSVRCASPSFRRSPAPSCDLLGRQPVAIGVEAARERLVGAVDVGGAARLRSTSSAQSNPACGRSAASSTAGRSPAARVAGGGAAGAPSTGIDDTGGATARPSCASVVSWRWIIPASDSATSSRRALSREISARSRITSSCRVPSMLWMNASSTGSEVMSCNRSSRIGRQRHVLVVVLLQRRLLARARRSAAGCPQDRRRGRPLRAGGSVRRPPHPRP